MLRNGKDHTFPPAYSRRAGEVFVRIDACLTDALHYLNPVVQQSPFPTRLADAVPVQHQLMLNELERVRSAMQTITARHHLSLPAPTTSAIESCRLRISEAMLALSELDPRTASATSTAADQGLSEDVEEDASRLVGHLMGLLDALQGSLSRDIGIGTPSERPVASPASAGPQCASTGAPAHPLIAELERITASHGLGDLHRRSMDFARHYGSTDIVVGLFGAVSAGKSSLLNSLLGSALLPVTALPTTAIPVEIHHGRVERGTVEFVTTKIELIDRARIAEFVDEHSNPGNARGITRITFECPAPLLSGGITLIDTPGVDWEEWDIVQGSPPTAPWCDIAVVLISATAPLTLRESALVRQLCSRGARVAVLVTKIDLVTADDRWRIYEHVVRGLWKSTRLDIPVYLVSTREEDPPWRRAWIDGPFADALAQCRKQRTEMRLRQLATLRRDVLDALEVRLMWHVPATHAGAQRDEALQALLASRDAVDATIRSQTDPAKTVERTMISLVSEIAHNAAALWSETHDMSFDATRLVELAANARALSLSGAATRTVETLHARASVALHHLADTPGPARLAPARPASFVAPAFILRETLPSTVLPRSLGRVFGRWGFYFSARSALEDSASMYVVERSLNAYLELLESRKQRTLVALVQTLTEHIERLQGGHGPDDAVMQRTVHCLRDDIARLRSAELSDSSGK
ncbi:dynamin family protein [Paraburkholderia oxyphila]|uniref:dynamin family protein n=1 Tax=Paraburkholderia oxyphila TaxID=614212 RepID=UPI00048148DD|nr:dynamin family protein [Paraburkholderia oxyphila]